MFTQVFRIPTILSLIAVAATFAFAGFEAALTVLILAVLEVSLSFDNAVVNAKILARMNAYWQRLFLTLGMVIAVFGMRLVFPLIIVSLAGHLPPGAVLDLAFHRPNEYAAVLHEAHPAIAAFGGMFLLMLFLDFILASRKIRWLDRLETALARVGRLEHFAVIISLAALLVTATFLAGDHAESVLLSGLLGLLTYLSVSSLAKLFESGHAVGHEDHAVTHVPQAVAQAGLFSFIYLEILDASFSFDGVVGAFAITNQILLISLGLGIGALYVRALTIYLVKQKTLAKYVYLEHGAHYAIGALAILLLATIKYDIPEAITGLLGMGIIAIAFFDSREQLRRQNARSTARQ